MTIVRAAHSETELGPPILGWLTDRGYDLYQEVVVGSWSADIVGVMGKRVAIVELKRSFTFDLVAQAFDRKRYAHHVYVAVPWTKASDGRRVAERICAREGIGVLYVRGRADAVGGQDVTLEVAPATNRKALSSHILNALHERQKTFAPAGTSGKRWTPFKATIEQVQRTVTTQPGITMKALVASFKHHYANDLSARQHLADWIERGKVPGVRIERVGRALTVVPTV